MNSSALALLFLAAVAVTGCFGDDFICKDDGYFADPKNCIKYYHCFGGEVEEHLTCGKVSGKQLCYDPDKVWCNWCPSVSCGDRPICDAQDEHCHDQKPTAHARPGFRMRPLN